MIHRQDKKIEKRRKLFLKFLDFHSCHLYAISALLVIHVACFNLLKSLKKRLIKKKGFQLKFGLKIRKYRI